MYNFDVYSENTLIEFEEIIKKSYKDRFGEDLLFEFEKEKIKQILFETYFSNKTIWNMKIKPDINWFIVDVRLKLQKKKGFPIW